MRERARSRDGTPIAFERFGGGQPIVLVGGALSDRQAGAPIAAALADRFEAIAYDRRGRGDSGDTPPYAVEREVEDLAALIDAAGGSAVVYGHSSGAVLALEAALADVPIERLVLYEPPFIVDDGRPPLPADHAATLERLASSGDRGDAVAYFLTTGVGLPADAVEQMRRAPMWPGMEALAHTIAYDVRVMGDTTSRDPLALRRFTPVTVPALVMDGGASPAWIRNGARALAEVLPNARHRTLAGQDHAAAPEVLAGAVTEFLSD